jgi:hypothetical protein
MRYRGRFNGHDYLGDWTEELMTRRAAQGVGRWVLERYRAWLRAIHTSLDGISGWTNILRCCRFQAFTLFFIIIQSTSLLCSHFLRSDVTLRYEHASLESRY